MNLHILSGGAAQGVVTGLESEFRVSSGAGLDAAFGAVGAMRERLLAGEQCDVVILTAALIADLEREGRVLPGTSMPLGRVRTGIAVRAGDGLPVIDREPALRAALVAAAGIYFPDPELATAGIHFMKVLTLLGIRAEVAPRLKAFPNGATAMRELAHSTEPGSLGCTQITEIRSTSGVTLLGPLPAGFELATVYTAAVCTGAREPELARRFTELLSDPAAQAFRANCGFE